MIQTETARMLESMGLDMSAAAAAAVERGGAAGRGGGASVRRTPPIPQIREYLRHYFMSNSLSILIFLSLFSMTS